MTENTVTTPGVGAGADGPNLAPIAASRRIDAMDILRGLALIGILVMNVEWFGRSINDIGVFDTDLTGLDHAVAWLVRCLVEGKFYKLFALLFGMGFAVMLIRAREVDKPFGAWFTRRMLVLFAIGMLHMIFLWGGDILHDYSFAGLVFLGWIYLLQTKRLKRFDHPKAFLKMGIGWMMFPFVISTVAAVVFGVRFDTTALERQWQEEQRVEAMIEAGLEAPIAEAAVAAEDTETDPDRELSDEEQIEKDVAESVDSRRERDAKIDAEVEVYTTGTYWEATKYRFGDAISRLLFTPGFTLLILMPVFLIGYWFVASGVLRNYRENKHIFRPMAWLGMSFGLFFTVGGLSVMQHPVNSTSTIVSAAGNTLFFFGQYVLSAGYLGSIMMLLCSSTWLRRLGRFAPMGRMALTNYIMHTVILASIFHGYAGGYYGEIGRGPQLLIVAAILIMQLYLSTWWLGRYRFGPLEWVWRSLTYKSMQPMRITS
jgi:uncharacterized membrane protein YeiB